MSGAPGCLGRFTLNVWSSLEASRRHAEASEDRAASKRACQVSLCSLTGNWKICSKSQSPCGKSVRYLYIVFDSSGRSDKPDKVRRFNTSPANCSTGRLSSSRESGRFILSSGDSIMAASKPGMPSKPASRIWFSIRTTESSLAPEQNQR
jgi:hypothetical protein